jgi:hypothetical protein
MQLTLVGMSHYDRSDECPLIHFDRQLDAGWSSVYASSKSDIIIKFGTIPRKDKAEVKWQLKNEIAAYGKLGQIAGWVVPQLYGEYEWYGGRALMMTNGGPSLEAFTSLCLIQRYVSWHFDETCIDYVAELSYFVSYT